MKTWAGQYTYSAGDWSQWGYRPRADFERPADPKTYARAWHAWGEIVHPPGTIFTAADFGQFEDEVIGLFHTRREAAEYLAACLAGAPARAAFLDALVPLVDVEAVIEWFSRDLAGGVIDLEDVGVLLFVPGGGEAVRQLGGPEFWEA